MAPTMVIMILQEDLYTTHGKRWEMINDIGKDGAIGLIHVGPDSKGDLKYFTEWHMSATRRTTQRYFIDAPRWWVPDLDCRPGDGTDERYQMPETAMTPNTSRDMLSALPAEIRSQILRHVVLDKSHKSPFGILTASRRLNSEAGPLLYGNVRFVFDQISAGLTFLKQIGPENTARIRYLHIPLYRLETPGTCDDPPEALIEYGIETIQRQDLIAYIAKDATSLEHAIFWNGFEGRGFPGTAWPPRPQKTANPIRKLVEGLEAMRGLKELRLRQTLETPLATILWAAHLGIQKSEFRHKKHLSLCYAHGEDVAKAQAAMEEIQEPDWMFVWYDWIRGYPLVYMAFDQDTIDVIESLS